MIPILAGVGSAMAGLGGAAAGGGMMSWLGPLLGAGVSGLSSLGGGLLQGSQGQASARAQMAFQERMYRHRYRYTMQDLRKAGLNPILAAEVGGGSAPSGAGYGYPNVLEGVSNSARQVASEIASIQSIRQEISESRARESAAKAQARLTKANAGLVEAELPRKGFQEKVGEKIFGAAGDVIDNPTGWLEDLSRNVMESLFQRGIGEFSAKKGRAKFDNVESGSSSRQIDSGKRERLWLFPDAKPSKGGRF